MSSIAIQAPRPRDSFFHRLQLTRRVSLMALLGAIAGIHAHAQPASPPDGAREAAAATPAGLQGQVVTSELGSLKIHTYVSPPQGFLVGTQIVEGPTQLIVFDGQLLKPYAEEVARLAAGLGKPVSRIIVSHAHPDHWSGLEVLTARFPQAPVYALPDVAAQITAQGDTMLDGLRRVFGDSVASKKTVPTEMLAEGEQRIDGVRFDFRRVIDAESDVQLLALLPDQKVMLAFDLVFAPTDHVFTVVPHFDHWIQIIEGLQKLDEYKRIFVGHGLPTGREAYGSTVEYLRKAKEIYRDAPDGKAYADALKAAFPQRLQPGWADFSGRVLYARRSRT